jgi:hypothetical protein
VKRPEQSLHRAVARYLDMALPSDCWWSTFPSGGGGKVRGAQLKAMGLKAGVPDILILHKVGTERLVIWIELKAAKGRASVEQQLLHRTLQRLGGFVFICRSVEEVEESLFGLGLVLRATVGRRAA